jgi:hypothetical protein
MKDVIGQHRRLEDDFRHKLVSCYLDIYNKQEQYNTECNPPLQHSFSTFFMLGIIFFIEIVVQARLLTYIFVLL